MQALCKPHFVIKYVLLIYLVMIDNYVIIEESCDNLKQPEVSRN